MPRRCEICSSEQRQEIDEKLVRNVANSHIASEYGFTERQVGSHKKDHVTPFVADANAMAQQAIVDRVTEYRAEVNLLPLVKVKLMQDKLFHELESASDVDERLAIIKEFRGWSIEEAKLTGAYIKDASNPADAKPMAEEYAKALQDELKYKPEQARELAAQIYGETVH